MITGYNIQINGNEHWQIKVEVLQDGSFVAWSASTVVQGHGPSEVDACEDLVSRAMSQPLRTAVIYQFPKRGRFASA